jgi:beta-glucosidase
MTDRRTTTDRVIDHLSEALALTTGADYWTTASAPSLGIRSIRMADGPHGLRVQNDENPDHLGLERSMPATCFPPAVTLASSWDESLVEAIGEALGREARAAGVDVVLGPGLNIKRSPLCGRNFEYYSEDPYLAGMMAGAAARGLQNVGVAACLKHFAANNQETDRLRVSANMDERTLREIYLRAFQIALQVSNSWAIMSSYNKINGTYASENHWLLTDFLREELGFDGVVISDWGAVQDPVAALNAGLDLRMPGRPGDDRLKQAVASGQLDKDALGRTIERLRLLADRTDHPQQPEAIDFDAHHDLTRRAASESAVLLTNDGALPLDIVPGLRVAVIGELASIPRYQGAGSSRVNPRRVVTGLEAIITRAERAGATLEFASGYTLAESGDPAAALTEAVALARRSDVVILFLGLPGEFEAEGSDRTNIDLPPDQLALVSALQGACPSIIATMSNGSVVTTAGWRHAVNAIVEFWLTGQAHGDAIADVLFGDVNPSGKLAETVPLRLKDTPCYLNFPGEHGNVAYGEGIHVGYRFYDARDLSVDYPFGHGLSYTRFDYEALEITVAPLTEPTAFHASVTLRNSGSRAGSEVVQLYVHDHSAAMVTPPLELRGWKKVHLEPGETVVVDIPVTRERLEHWHIAAGRWTYAGGSMTVHVGGSSRDLQLQSLIEVPGEPIRTLLTPWSSLGEWLDDPDMGRRLTEIFAARGGVKGRIGDLLSDKAGQQSVRASPLIMIAEFPGVPLVPADIDALCTEAANSASEALLG